MENKLPITQHLPTLLEQCVNRFPAPGPSSRDHFEDKSFHLVPIETAWPAAFHPDTKGLEGRHILVEHTVHRFFDYWVPSVTLFPATAQLNARLDKITEAATAALTKNVAPDVMADIVWQIENIKSLIGDRRLEDLPGKAK